MTYHVILGRFVVNYERAVDIYLVYMPVCNCTFFTGERKLVSSTIY